MPTHKKSRAVSPTAMEAFSFTNCEWACVRHNLSPPRHVEMPSREMWIFEESMYAWPCVFSLFWILDCRKNLPQHASTFKWLEGVLQSVYTPRGACKIEQHTGGWFLMSDSDGWRASLDAVRCICLLFNQSTMYYLLGSKFCTCSQWYGPPDVFQLLQCYCCYPHQGLVEVKEEACKKCCKYIRSSD